MKLEILEPARAEFFEAIQYYNNEREGLGYEFAGEIKKSILRIVRNSEAWTSLSKKVRRCIVNRFPYAILFQKRKTGILIVSVMHMSRNPVCWRDRI